MIQFIPLRVISLMMLLLLAITMPLTSCKSGKQNNNSSKQNESSADSLQNQTIHQQAVVIDTHTDTPMKLINGYFNLAERHQAPDSRVDFPRLRAGDVDAVFFALYTGQRKRTSENYLQAYNLANQMLDSTLAAIKRNPQMVTLATSPADILNASAQNKAAICLGMENGFPLAKDITRVKAFYDKGVRYITLSHSSNNDICDSSTDKKGAEHNGLSSFGKAVVAEMNRLGMMVDVSHISDKSFYDVLEVSKAPVIASHSSVRALCNHPRNLSDDMIKALAVKGGVIQICILGGYIADEDTGSVNYRKLEELRLKYNNWQYKDDEERKKVWKEYDSINKFYPPVLPDIARAVDHIDHVVKLVGIDHVGIGSDFDGGGGLSDCRDVTDFPKITDELIQRGYSADDIAKIWGGNFLRVFREVEKIAAL
ncbi:MAG: dipeptidase [Bacteroidales bacterium]|nr:dipeptidase [Bacteroidales bacterium]